MVEDTEIQYNFDPAFDPAFRVNEHPMSSSSPSSAGVPFGRFLIRARLGKGGMGEVFLADQLGPQGPVRQVALKRLLPHMMRDETKLQLFLEEITTAAQLNHPNIATTYDFGEEDAVFYLAMEFVDGLPLDRVLAHTGPLSLEASLAIGLGVARALDHAHTQGNAVHQDVSPHNIMISTRGEVKLVDFGIAKAERASLGGKVRGKRAYAAPEQLRGAPPDRRFDLWALGVVLYQCLCAEVPFAAPTLSAVVHLAEAKDYLAIAQRRPEAAALGRIIDRALEPQPERRWSSAQEICEALESLSAPSQAHEQLGQIVALARPVQLAEESIEVTGTGAPALGSDTVMLKTRLVQAPARNLKPTEPTHLPGKTQASSPLNLKLPAVIAALTLLLGLFVWARFMRDEAHPVVAIPTVPVEPPLPKPRPQPRPDRVAAKTSTTAQEKASKKTARAVTASLPSRSRRPLKPRARRTKTRAAPVATSKPPPKPEGLGILSIRTTPWAKVLLDGRPLGEGIIASKPVQAGTHTLRLIPGQGRFPPRNLQIQIQPNQSTKILVDFNANTVKIIPPRAR